MSHDPQSQPARPPRISVLIRTRDRQRLLAEALESLVSQGYPSLQAVVVNDGGEGIDDTLKSFNGRLEITAIDLQPGRGRSAAANAAIEAADGEWLLILDDDDRYLPNALSRLAEAATSPDTVYYGNVLAYRYDEEGERQLERRFGAPFDRDLMYFENQIPFIGCLMPTAKVREAGGIDESLECFEDWDLYLRLAADCPFVHVDGDVAEYRIFGSSFISGKGGVELQREGLRRIYEKHLAEIDPQQFAAMQLAVKRTLIPREIGREVTAVHEQLSTEIERQLKRQTDAHDQLVRSLSEAHDQRERDLADQLDAALGEASCLKDDAGQTLLRVSDTFVSIVIVNYNGRHHLEYCLPALFETLLVPFEVIVVDNASSDDSVEWTRTHYPQVTLLAEKENLGFGRGNLHGIRAARGEYVVLLNSDTQVTPDWLFHLLQPMVADPGIGTTCSTLRLMHHPDQLNARGGGMSRLGFSYDIDFGHPYQPPAEDAPNQLTDVLFPSGAAMMVRKGEFLEMGGFDPAYFMYHEDVDLGWRYWLHGRRVVVCSKSVVFHAFGGTTKVEKGSSWRDWMGNRHNLRALIKNYEFRNAWRTSARLILLWIRGRHWGLAVHALWWNLLHIRGTLRERRRLQRLRRISDAELYARLLIDEPPFPAPPPMMPVGEPARDLAEWIVTPELFPGRYSALGRLGPGWHTPEYHDGGPVRATCGTAIAHLKLPAAQRGRLILDVHLPTDLQGESPITVTCNGARQRFELDGDAFWHPLELPAQSDGNGLLTVTIENPPWVPHQRFRNGDPRRLGCLVRSLRFIPETPWEKEPPSTVSVLITTYKRWSILEMTLEALTRQTHRPFEVIVVDDGSADETWERLQRWRDEHTDALNLKIFTQQNTGQGIARNNGLQHAEGDLVLFIGDDIIPEETFVEQHLSSHLALGVPAAVVGYTDWHRTEMRVTPLLDHVNEQGHQFGYAHMPDGGDVPYTCFYTSNVSLPREVLGDAPFDPNFRTYGWEDIEVGYRMSKRGLRIQYNRSARAHHVHPMTLTDFYTRQLKVGAAVNQLYDLQPELLGEASMPPERTPRFFALTRRILPLTVPLVDWLDRREIRLPARFYNQLLHVGYWIGRQG